MSEYRETGDVRLPPDSTGKRSGAAGRLVINFDGESSPTFSVGQTVTGGTSAATGEVVGVNRIAYPTGEGQLFIRADTQTGTFQNLEDLKVGPTIYAQVSSSVLDTIYYQKNILVDREDPSRYMNINDRGAANVSFGDGQPSLSTFGNLITSEVESVRQYVYSYTDLPSEFFDQVVGSGSLTYLSDERSVLMDTGFTASGDFSCRQSHFYHPYQPGNTLSVIMGMVMGDTGKTNVSRRWGLFDNNDGVYWELEDTTLYAVIRSSTTGSPVETRVAQTNFNEDTLDGTINFNLDLAKTNLYWIDIQWLGVGIVRFGIYEEDGQKTLAHTFNHANTNVSAYMKKATLPLRFEVFNRETAVSNSQLKNIASSIQNYGQTKMQLQSKSIDTTYKHPIGKASGEMPIITLRPSTTLNSLENRTVSAIGDISIYNEQAACLKINIKRNVFPSGASWNSIADSAVEWDQDSTGFLVNPSGKVWSTFIGSGETRHYNILNEAQQFQDDVVMVLHGDGATQAGVSITAEVVSNDQTNVSTSITWKELHT